MLSIRPKTYNELMRYQRCLEFKSKIGTLSDESLEEIYHFLGAARENSVVIRDNRMSFYHDSVLVKSSPVFLSEEYAALTLTAISLWVERPHSGSSGGSDGGSSGNNNNNNNNNNNS